MRLLSALVKFQKRISFIFIGHLKNDTLSISSANQSTTDSDQLECILDACVQVVISLGTEARLDWRARLQVSAELPGFKYNSCGLWTPSGRDRLGDRIWTFPQRNHHPPVYAGSDQRKEG